MKVRQIRTRDALGMAHHEVFVDVDGVIAITRQILKEQPDNAKAKYFLDWVDSLDHKVTAQEFQAWFIAHGGTFVDANSENMDN